MDLKPSELNWVCDHLGHTVDVHKEHYRCRSNVIERIEIAKVLLLQDTGMVKNFVGKSLKDIQFEGRLLKDIQFEGKLNCVYVLGGGV